MLYFKKADLAKTYHVSEKTVTNWVKEAKVGKIDLQLHEADGRAWITNTTRNIALIEQLVENRKKFRNSRGVKVISPKPEFYQLFNPQQIFDIASNLDIHRELPFQYGYFGTGAELWDQYAKRLADEPGLNFLTSSIKQLRANQDYIDGLLADYSRVNVIDVGPGNSLPVKDLLQHLLDQKKLGRYIAVDISPAMLAVAKRNIEGWFDGLVRFEGHQGDLNYDRFGELFAEETIGEHAHSTINIIIAFGGTFTNLRSPDGAFKVLHDSMNRNDLLLYHLKLDSEAARRYFDFGVNSKVVPLDTHTKFMVDLLNIDESFYDVEMGYDEQRRERYIRIRLKIALTIKFVFASGERTITLNKNDAILLWRYWHLTVPEILRQFNRTDFDVLQTSLTEDRDYLLTISRVKSERHS